MPNSIGTPLFLLMAGPHVAQFDGGERCVALRRRESILGEEAMGESKGAETIRKQDPSCETQVACFMMCLCIRPTIK